MEKVLIELLQATKNERHGNGKALQALRDEFGFNYAKPIKAVKFKDSFTATSLKKDFGIDCKTDTVAVIFHKGLWFETAEFTNGKCELIGGSISPLSTIVTKSDFDEWRKDGWYEVYVIAQNDKLLLSRNREGRYKGKYDLEIGKRYDLYDSTRDWYGVSERGVKKSPCNRVAVDYTGEFFDKSGYPVCVKREDLARRVKKVKDERNKRKYLEMTNTEDMIQKARKAIELKKIELSTRLLDCNTAEEISKFDSALSRFSGLYGCYCDIEEIERYDKDKRFSSPATFNNSIRAIYEKLAQI